MRMTELGCESQAIVQWVRGPEPGGVPTDDDVRSELARPGVDARFALLPEYGARPGEPMVLLAARLLDVESRGPIHVRGHWGYEPTGRVELDILAVTCELVRGMADALELRYADEDWRSAFGSSMPGPAVALLRATGCVELAARGHPISDQAACLRALVRAMQEAPDLRGAAELFPRLTLLAIDDPEIDDATLVEIWDTACAATCRMARSGWARIPELLRTRDQVAHEGDALPEDDGWLVADGNARRAGPRRAPLVD